MFLLSLKNTRNQILLYHIHMCCAIQMYVYVYMYVNIYIYMYEIVLLRKITANDKANYDNTNQ